MMIGSLLGGLFRRLSRAEQGPPRTSRGRIDHVVILDGTMSTLEPGFETNAGLTYKLLDEASRRARVSILYEAGVQWRNWSETLDVIEGRGINRQIRRAYGFISSRYRPGDRIYLFGYSRGAYAVRSLAGVIDRVGLLKAEHATERAVLQAYRHYQTQSGTEAAREFAARYCHADVEVEMVGVWDTVKALGFRAPILWRLSEERHAFHNHHLSPVVRHGFHALAMDETRQAYAPVLWACPPGHAGEVEQMWFRGTHGDVGGQLSGFEAARPLANIPLVWMLDKASVCGLPLPPDWRARFPCDSAAPSVGTMRGWGKFFLARKRRAMCLDPSERIHPTARPPTGRGSAPDPEIFVTR
jgi:uncharacterized protein (DUF2235 family)